MKTIEHVFPSWGVFNDGSQLFKDTVLEYLKIHFEKEYFEPENGWYYGIYNGSPDFWSNSNNFGNILLIENFIELTKGDEKNTLTIGAEYLFEFKNFTDWVNNATKRFKPYGQRFPTVCINTEGKVCHDGSDMMYSRDNKLFPVKVYSLERATK